MIYGSCHKAVCVTGLLFHGVINSQSTALWNVFWLRGRAYQAPKSGMAFMRVAYVVGCFFAKCKTETIGYIILLKIISFSHTNATVEIFCVLLKMYCFLNTCWSKLLGDTGSKLAFTGISNN